MDVPEGYAIIPCRIEYEERVFTGRSYVRLRDPWDICRTECDDPEIPYYIGGSHLMYIARAGIPPCFDTERNEPTERGQQKADGFLGSLVHSTFTTREKRELILKVFKDANRLWIGEFRGHLDPKRFRILREVILAAFKEGNLSQTDYQRGLKALKKVTKTDWDYRWYIVNYMWKELDEREGVVLSRDIMEQFLKDEGKFGAR